MVIAGAAVSVTLALGGMRAATSVHTFQFVLKLVRTNVGGMPLSVPRGRRPGEPDSRPGRPPCATGR